MFDEVDQRLSDWLKPIIGTDAHTTFTLPPTDPNQDAVGLYLLSFAPMPTPRGAERPPIQFTLRYLVTAWSGDPLHAHYLIGQVITAAHDAAETLSYQVDFAPLPPELWLAFGIAPRPAFVLGVPYQIERETEVVPPVRKPVVIQSGSGAFVHGRLITPDQVPIVGARIDVPSLQIYTFTDAKGAFHLSMVPRQQTLPVRIRAKGKTLNTALDTISDQPIVLTWNPLQD